MRREKRGVIVRNAIAPDQVALTYQGLDGKLRRINLTFAPVPKTLDLTSASYAIDLPPGRTRSVFLTVDCNPVSHSRRCNYSAAFARPARVKSGDPGRDHRRDLEPDFQ